MSTHVLPWTPTAYLVSATEAITAAVRAPESAVTTESTVTLTFTPDLTAGEVTTVTGIVADVVGLTNTAKPMSLAAYRAIRPDIQNIRDLRQMGRNAFMALTAAERDRLLYDAQAATTTILLALLRE
jgi:hypothetical protein